MDSAGTDPGHALVVGASSEIGRAISFELAGLGYSLSLWGRNIERLQHTAAACRHTGRVTMVDLVDVTDRAHLVDAVEAVTARGPLTSVVWATGVFDYSPADEADPQAWAQLFDINLVAAAILTGLVLPPLIAAAPGALIYIGSGAAHTIYPHNAAYVASKHGLAALARATFLDVRDRGIKVSLVSPGLVAAGSGLDSPTGRTRPQLLLQPADVAAAVRFVLTFPARGCPTEIQLQPQQTV